MTDKRIKIAGSSLLGVFARCTEEVVLVPLEVGPDLIEVLVAGLGVTAIRTTIADSSVVGSLVAANSTGFVVTPQASEDDILKLSEHGKVARLPGKTNAAGNIILANDHAALVHPGLSKRACDMIAKTLGVDLVQGTVGGLRTVGMTATATNQGLLVHPKVSAEELEVLADLFDIPIDVGTINLGSPLVGSGIIANSKGYFAGGETTGPELGRIEDALGFLK